MNNKGQNSAEGAAKFALVQTGARKVEHWTADSLQQVTFRVVEGKIGVIELSRPKNRNAWTEVMRNEICRCLDECSQDPEIRVVVLTGNPEGRAFCAGADLSPASNANPGSMEGDAPDGRSADLAHWRDGGGIAGLAVARSTKPVIAAINGAAVGVGMTLPLCCDITVAAENAKVGFVFGRRGLTMECLSSYFLERCVGHKAACELVLTGRVFRAKDAPPGLFNYTVPTDQVLGKALAIAREICLTSPMSSMLNRQMILRNGHATSPEQAHLIESRSIYAMSRGPDAREGIASFLEKREPTFPMDPYKDSPPWFPWWQAVETKSKL